MLIASQEVFATVLLLGLAFRDSKGSCKNENKHVTCESVRYISKEMTVLIPNISEVEFMTIQSNPDLEIFPQAFRAAVKLKGLSINNNTNIKLHEGCFQNTTSTFISLIGNGIKSIPTGMFSNLPLKVLRLEDNNLEEVPSGFVNSTLHVILLSNNRIESIKQNALENLSSLKQIRLNSNGLQSVIPHKILTYPQRLGALDVVNNSLTAITNYMLQDLEELLFLKLSHNAISFIEDNCFENTPKLQLLILSNNHLKEVDENIFPSRGMSSLFKLFLDNNMLMYLPSKLFTRLRNLSEVSIIGNPWSCSCLFTLERLLEELKVVVDGSCSEQHAIGRIPICVRKKGVGNDRCQHVYNQKLSEKFMNRKRKLLPGPPRSCNGGYIFYFYS